MKNKIIKIVIGIVIVAGIAFYGGMKYAESKSSSGNFSAQGGSASGGQNLQNLSPEERQARLQQFGAAGFAGGQKGTRAGGESAAGEVIAKDDKSITVKLSDGGSKIVFFTANTPVMKSVPGLPQDIAIGTQVVANGTKNQDGSITSQSIQIRPKSQ
jgi:hypothetical protein